MRQRVKRLLALILCMAMLGPAIPASAAQRNETELLPDNSASALAAEWLVTPENTAEPNAGPAITAQPQNRSAAVGATAKFSVTATGTGLKYQWQYKYPDGSWTNSGFASAKTSTLSFTAQAKYNNILYRCIVTDANGRKATSSSAKLTIKTTITAQPQNKSAAVGTTVKFTITATGAGLKYQWQYKYPDGSWTNSGYASGKTAALSFTVQAKYNNMQYRCVITDANGKKTTSSAVTLTVKPKITSQPEYYYGVIGETAKFKVKATGAGLTYQWQYKYPDGNWTNSGFSSAKTSTLSFTIRAKYDEIEYRCIIKDANGKKVTSNTAMLRITPKITGEPKSVTAGLGTTAKFTVTATGTNLGYQWQYRYPNGEWKNSGYSSASSATLKVPALAKYNGMQYRCLVSTYAAYVCSDTVTLTVDSEIRITSQPQDAYIKEGGTAVFSVKAVNVESYQWYWWKASESCWVKCTDPTAKTATLKYTNVRYSWNGYWFCCLLTNSEGSRWTDEVSITITERRNVEIYSQPESVSIKEGEDAVFSVGARYADSYQWYWWKASVGGWVKCTDPTAKTSTLTYSDVKNSWNGYRFCCLVTNTKGSCWSEEVTITITERHVPVIYSQPKSATFNEGEEAAFSVGARYADSYQWYWWKASENSWVECTGAAAKTSTLKYTDIKYSWNYYQFRCKVTNTKSSVYSSIVTLTVNPVRYRALLVGEVNYKNMAKAERFGADCDNLKTALESVKGPMGRKYTATVKKDLSVQGCKDAISSTFSAADENDVSLFFIQTHGATSIASGENAGRLRMIGATQDEHMTLKELAEALAAVPGTVIVWIGSCGSGAAIWESNNGGTDSGEDPLLFNELVVSAFAEAENAIADPNTGEFRDPKFYVLTAAAHQEESWGSEENLSTCFARHIIGGITGDKPADDDDNGTITLNELYEYLYEKCLGPHGPTGDVTHYQHVQVYPENSSYPLFR